MLSENIVFFVIGSQGSGELILKARILLRRTERAFISYLYTKVHGIILHKSQKVATPKCPSMDEQIHKMWHKHKMEYHSALKRNGLLTQATQWMTLKDVLSEINQKQKDNHWMIPHI